MNDREYIYDKLIDHEVMRRQLIKQRDEWYKQPISQLTVKSVLALQQIDRAIDRLDEYIRFDKEYLGIDECFAVKEAERIANSLQGN